MAELNAVVVRGAERLGRLVDRGAFDPYAAYLPGEVALDDGVPYVNVVAVGGPLLARDTFARADANRWGITSDGQEWLPYVQAGQSTLARVLNGRGVLTGHVPSPGSTTLLLDIAPGGDHDVLAAVRFTVAALNSNTGPHIMFAADTDLQNFIEVSTFRDSDSKLNIYWNPSGIDGTWGDPAVSSFVLGDDALVWLRVRGAGTAVSARAWLDGTREPETWDITGTCPTWGVAPRLGLGVLLESTDDVVGVDYFSARDLSTALDAPSADSAHWLSLLDGFGVPTPY